VAAVRRQRAPQTRATSVTATTTQRIKQHQRQGSQLLGEREPCELVRRESITMTSGVVANRWVQAAR
jgi:hypothetical protein